MSKLWQVFWLALVVKLGLAAIIPLTNDEAYYWVWSEHMQLSYFDHPPFVAWLFWLGHFTDFYGGMVRWPAVLFGHGTLFIWLVILRRFFSQQQLLYWLGLALLSPLVGGTNLVVTPDLPLLFFYALALWLFFRWRDNPRYPLSLAWGLSLGLGFASKYVMVLFPLSFFPLVLLSKQVRGPFFRQLGWITLGAVVGATPVWLWNFLNDFASLRFQASHGLGPEPWKVSWTTDYALAQIGLIFPPIFYWALRSRGKLPKIFHLLAWVPLLFFWATTSRRYAEANWPIVAYPAIFALAVSCFPHNIRSLRLTMSVWGAVLAGLAAVIVLQPNWAKATKFREFHEFEGLIQSAQGLDPMFARSYQMAAKMNFEMKHPVYKLRGMNRKDFYDFISQSQPHSKSFYLAVEKGDTLPPEISNAGYKITEVKPVNERFEIWRVAESL